MSINITQSNNQSINIQEGDSSVVSIETVEGTNVSVVEKGQKGDPGVQGEKGEKGDQGETGAGVKEGGATSTFLVKSSGDDYDTQWTSDLSSNSIVNTNTIFSVGAITTLGNLSTNNQLTAGSITTVGGPITAGNVTSTATTTSTVNITGASSQSIVYQGLIYDDFKLLSTGNIVNIIDSDNDGVNKQFIVADHTETPLMVVDEGGNVGIGTTSPEEKLDVHGNVRFVLEGQTTANAMTITGIGSSTHQITGGNNLQIDHPYLDAANSLRLASGGVNKFVSIGTTTNNNSRLHVKGSTSDNTAKAFSIFDSSGSELFNVVNDGNVGIGTTSPAQKLQVEGNIRFASDGAGSNWMEFRRNVNNNWTWDTNGVGSIMTQTGNLTTWAQDFKVTRAGLIVAPSLGYAQRAINVDHTWNDATRDFATIDIDVTDTASSGNSSFIDIAKGGTTGFIVDEDFNVGIGTASPTQKLEVSGGNVKANNFYSTYGLANYGNDMAIYNTVNNTGSIRFITQNNGSQLESMRISNNGNIGIGTAAPGTKLHVVGNSYVQGDMAVGPQGNGGPISGYTLSIRDTTPSIYLKDQSGLFGDGRLHVNNSIFSIGVDPDNVTADAALRFETRASERMRIDADGRVGIGTTTPTESLQIGQPATGSSQTDHHILLTGYDVAGIKWNMHGGWSKAKLTSDLGGNINFINEGSVAKETSFNIGSNYNYLSENEGRVWIKNSGVGNALTFGRNGPYPIATVRVDATGGAASYFGGLTFNVRESTTVTHDTLTLEKTGKVGIGTTSPSEKLHVEGSVNVVGERVSFTGVNDNTIFGTGGQSITTGYWNTLIGTQAGGGISTGAQNIVIGRRSMLSSNGSNNVAIGREALKSGASNNIAIGEAAAALTTGGSNVIIGTAAGNATGATYSNTVGIGTSALTSLTTGTNNTAVGYQAGYNITESGQNTLIGYRAGFNKTNSTGRNATLGYESLYSDTNGYDNTAIGYQALYSANPSYKNTAVGFSAGTWTTGNYNALLGSDAGKGVSGASTFSNTTAVGYQALTALTTGTYNTAIGFETNHNLQTGGQNTSLGARAGYLTGGSNNTAIGYRAGRASSNYGTFLGSLAGESTTADGITAVGYQALTSLTTGTGNTAVGYQAGDTLTTGNSNTMLGYLAGDSITTGVSNTIIGAEADGASNANRTAVTLIGHAANADGDYAVSIGWLAKASNFSTSVGTLAGGNSSNAEFNVFVGDSSGRFNSGDRNVFVGRSAGYSSGNSAGNVFLGYNAGYNETGSNKLYIENSNSSTPLIYGEFDNDLVRINGDLQVTGDIDLSGGVTRNILVNGDQYVFQYASGGTVTNYGLYFNLTDVSFDFNNASATAVMSIGAATGDTEVLGYVESKSIKVDDTGLSAAGDYGKSAEIWYQGTGATTAGSLYYLNSSGDWANTDASAASTAKGMLAFAAGTDSDVDGMITRGFVYLGTDPGGSVGDQVFLSETANAATTTAPSTSGAIVRVIGHKVATNVIYFNPSNDYFEVE